ncbi:MAG: hypothetical protein RL328_637, partial [Acidobacteriota bacterium]
AAVVLVLTHTLWLTALGSFLVSDHAPVKADIALVLAGDFRGGRMIRAAELVKQGFVPKVLVSGPDGAFGNYECDLAIPFAVRAGYPEEYFVHLENMARSTREEAEAAAGVLRKMGVHKVLVVTSNFHTRRAERMYHEAVPDLDIVMVGSSDPYFSPDGWWKNREGQKTFLYEWMKTVASWVNL